MGVQLSKETPINIDHAALYSVEIEYGLLGAILNSSSIFDVIEPLVSADDFGEPLHAQLFETLAHTHETGGLITLPLVVAAMGAHASGLIADGMTAGQYVARIAAEAVTI